MNIKPNQPTTETAMLPAAPATIRATSGSFLAGRRGVLACAALMLLAAAGSALAIDATVNGMTSVDGRLTVPIGSTDAYTSTISVTLGGATTTNDPAVATLSATGVPSTGGGAAVVFDSLSVTNATTSAATVDVTFTLNYTNLDQGDYDMAIEAAGANTWRLPMPVKAGYQWSAGGGTNNIAFGDTANWVGGAVPGPGDIVILSDAGLAGDSGTPTIGITGDTTIGSVSDVHTGSDYQHWNIAAGATLSVLGDGGWWHITDVLDSNDRKRVRGSGEGTLVISNANATFGLYHTRQNNSYDASDFSALNTMIVDVSRIAIHDGPTYPNNLTNGTLERPRRNIHDIDWAKTNILRATWTDTNDWQTPDSQYGLVLNRFFDSTYTGNDGGMHFKTWNEVYCDSILWGGLGAQMENPEVDLESGGYLKVRNTDGVSRVSNITIADNRDYMDPEDPVGGASKIDVVFNSGTVDILVDTLYIGRAPNIGDGGQADGEIQVGAGMLDVNNAILGYQQGAGLGTDRGYGQGRVQVEKGGVFRVNDTLVLGYTESTNPATGYNVEGGGGTVNVIGPGSAEINLITVGGVTKLSQNNAINISDGGNLIVTNTAGAIDAPINSFNISDGTISIFANPSVTNVFAETLSSGGSGGVIKILGVTGVSSYPATIPVFSYVNPTAAALSLDVSELGAGFYGYVINDTVGSTFKAVITTVAPQSLVWDGGDGNWDQSTANWKDSKVFSDGDQVTFDDTASGITTVNVVGTEIVGSGGVLVTNDAKAYTLGGGTITGSATLTKEGTGSLTIDATSELALDQLAGTVSVGAAGAVGSVTTATNTVLNNAGTTGKVTASGAVNNTGTMNGLDLQTGGVMQNSAGATISGYFYTRGGSMATIAAGSTVEQGVERAKVLEDSTLVLDGQWNNNTDRLEVRGLLTGSGTVSDFTGDTAGNQGRLTIAQTTSTFAPGGIDTIGIFNVEGRLDLDKAPATMIIDVDLNDPATNDVVYCDKFSNIRGVIQMNNIGAVPFAAGQTFSIYKINFDLYPNVPENTGASIDPAVPGVGLQWDLSRLFDYGEVSVITAPVSPAPDLTTTVDVTAGTQTISWTAEYLGYQLQVQTNDMTTGISTNWFPIEGTEDATSYSAPIDPANPTVFYRLSNQ